MAIASNAADRKKVRLINEDGLPDNLVFLPQSDRIELPPAEPLDVEVAIALDTATKPRLGDKALHAASKAKPTREIPSLDPGDLVQHDSFGLGTVVAVEGAGDRAVASIDFGSEGVKRLLLRYAPVEKL